MEQPDITRTNLLVKIQNELKANKIQYNSFGRYNYRNCEDILESVKPLLRKYNAILTISDEIINIAGRFYVKATATLECEKTFIITAYAREEEAKKGMDASQITGAASSYARKYALNGLFLIDDNKDSDTTNIESDDKITVPTQINIPEALELVNSVEELTSLKEEIKAQKMWTPENEKLLKLKYQELQG